MNVRRSDVATDLAVILLLIIVIILIIWVHCASPFLTVGALSLVSSRAWTVGITVAATITTSFIGSQIQYGLIRSLENRLRKVGMEPHLIQDPTNNTADDDQHVVMKNAEQDWRAILNIDSSWEKVINFRISLIFLLCTLITTSIVSSLTPTLSTRSEPFDALIPDTNFGFYSDALNRSCFGICEAPCNESMRSAYRWALDNGSFFYAANDGECPPAYALQMAQGINTDNVTDNVYSQAGVAVQNTAIGAPTSIFSGAAFRNISSTYGQALVNTTQCVPIITKNPVRCQAGGNVTIKSSNEIELTTNSITAFGETWPGGASTSMTIRRNFATDSGMVDYAWTLPWAGAEHVGKVLLGFGVVNDPLGQVPFASYLAGAINDPDEPKYRVGGATYAVTCVVNPRNAFEYRLVTLDLRALGEAKGSNLAQYLSGSEPCTPTNPTISNKLFTIAGIASHQLVREQSAMDGYIATLNRLAGFHREPPYAFPDSNNAFEDVLGIVSGLAVSRISLAGGSVPASALDGQGGRSTALVEVTRLGSDSGDTLWLLIPPLGSLIILSVLSFLSFRRNWIPGGRDFPGTPEERPNRYAAESLYQIITLGTNYYFKEISRDE
ncbi:hypothetical protein F4677DRAFT_461436 [Hypoxylon crocopeplum]|nr:hypothetical protein F4677DRAFT_461436 [Hypoxylon crocopeplum]